MPSKHGPPINLEKRRAAHELRASGLKLAVIGRRLGLTAARVCQLLRPVSAAQLERAGEPPMPKLYELERTITDELSRYTPDVDGDPADGDFVEPLARRIHEQHIQPLATEIERLKKELAAFNFEEDE